MMMNNPNYCYVRIREGMSCPQQVQCNYWNFDQSVISSNVQQQPQSNTFNPQQLESSLQLYSYEQLVVLQNLLIKLQESQQQTCLPIFEQPNVIPKPDETNSTTLIDQSESSSSSTSSTNTKKPSSKITKQHKRKKQGETKLFSTMCSSFRANLTFDIKTVESYEKELLDRSLLRKSQPKRGRGRPKKVEPNHYHDFL